uniref:Tudor domain-containing protein n=1 Tax=Steinernema glaseri TaxID=37863 RepID=A0A1I8A9W6_9BILA
MYHLTNGVKELGRGLTGMSVCSKYPAKNREQANQMQNATMFVRIPLADSRESLSESVALDTVNPPTLLNCLEKYLPKYQALHRLSTGEVYGYVKLHHQDFNEYIDVDCSIYEHQPVAAGDKIELWYVESKKHPNAVLLTKLDVMDTSNRETTDTANLVNETPVGHCFCPINVHFSDQSTL